MFIAAAKLILDFYGNDDIASKRQEMKKLAAEVHRKLNVSAYEIFEKVDDPERCVLGLSLVSSSYQDARSAMDQALKFVDKTAFARVTNEDIEIYQFGEREQFRFA